MLYAIEFFVVFCSEMRVGVFAPTKLEVGGVAPRLLM